MSSIVLSIFLIIGRSNLYGRHLYISRLYSLDTILALAQMPAMTAVYGAVNKKDKGDAAVLVNITQRLGGAFGAIIVFVALNQSGLSLSVEEYILAFLLLTILALGALCSAIGLSLCKPYVERDDSQKALRLAD